MGEHSVVKRKLLLRQNGLAGGYFYAGNVMDREEFKLGTQSVQDHLLVIDEGD
jgi:hypothetical protein